MEPTENTCLEGIAEEPNAQGDLLFLPEPQSPSLSSRLLSLPPAEGLAGPENFGDGQISPMDEETNAPLVATHGTGAGQSSSHFSLSSTTSNEFDEEVVQQATMELQRELDQLMVPDGLSNTTNGGQAASSHADAVPPVVQQGTSTTADELPHPQQQLPLPMNDPEAQPGGGWAWLNLPLVDEVQIQQMMPTISPSQLPPPTPVLNPGPDKANHAASAPMGSQGTLIPAAPQDQEADVPSRALTRRRAIKNRGLPSRPQDWFGKPFDMGMDMLRQFGRHIGKMMKDEEHRSKVWQHFWRLYCKYCDTTAMICQYCKTVMIDLSIIELLSHLESCDNNMHRLPASSRASNETQRSSHQTLQIKEIAENPNGESEPIETENSNCATAARVDTQGTNAVVLSPWQQHQLPMDLKELKATVVQPGYQCQCPTSVCKFTNCVYMSGSIKYFVLDETDSLCDLIIRLSDSSGRSSTTNSTHHGFRLKFSNKETGAQIASKETPCKIVHVDSSSEAWVHVSESKDHDGVFLGTGSDSDPIGNSYLMVGVNFDDRKSAPAGYAYPWQHMYLVLRSLGFRKEFATNFVIYALGWLDGCNLRLRSPRSSNNKGKSIVEQGDVSSGKRKRKPAPPRSKVWNHFTKEVVEAEGSMVTKARCNHCGYKGTYDYGTSVSQKKRSYGTSHLARHIITKHPEHAESL